MVDVYAASIMLEIDHRESENVGARGVAISNGVFRAMRFERGYQYSGDASQGRNLDVIVTNPFLVVQHQNTGKEYMIDINEAEKWLGDNCDGVLLKLYHEQNNHPPQHCQVYSKPTLVPL